MARQSGQPVGLRPWNVDEELACRGYVGDVEDLVGEPSQRALSQRDQPHRHVDADDRYGGMNAVLDYLQVAVDVLAAAYAVDDR